MLLTISLVLLCITAIVLAIQDFKEFQVSIWILAVFSGLILTSLFTFGQEQNLFVLLTNSLFTSVGVLVFLFLYARFRFPSKQFLKDVFGLGDVIFILATSCLLTPAGFIAFLVSSSVVAICSTFLFGLKRGAKKDSHIPFIGYMGLVFSCFVGYLLFMIDKNDYLSTLVFNLNI